MNDIGRMLSGIVVGLVVGSGVGGSVVDGVAKKEAVKAECGYYEPNTGYFKFGKKP